MNKYLRQCRQLFPIYGKYERRMMKGFRESVKAYTEENPGCTYEMIVEHFGSPKDFIISYYDTIELDKLIKKINIAGNIHKLIMFLIIAILMFFVIRTAFEWKYFTDAENSLPTSQETTIEIIDSK